jgi:hypothetical protein
MLFLGDGKGSFEYTPQYQSGLTIRGNVRSLQVISSGQKNDLIFGINNAPVQVMKLK